MKFNGFICWKSNEKNFDFLQCVNRNATNHPHVERPNGRLHINDHDKSYFPNFPKGLLGLKMINHAQSTSVCLNLPLPTIIPYNANTNNCDNSVSRSRCPLSTFSTQFTGLGEISYIAVYKMLSFGPLYNIHLSDGSVVEWKVVALNYIIICQWCDQSVPIDRCNCTIFGLNCV